MSQHRIVDNKLDGHVEGPTIQAGAVGIASVSWSKVNNVFKEVRALNTLPTLYRALASLMSLAALAGVRHGGTPLAGAAFMCDRLAIPTGWTGCIANWMAGRTNLVTAVAAPLLAVGLLALPKRRHLGWALEQALEWRGPSTTVLSFVALVQCGQVWHALILMSVLAAVGILVIKNGDHRHDGLERALTPVVGIALAVFFVPLYVFVWLFSKDSGSAPYIPDND
ncbi:hypothetical protein [Streptomyces rimosus]|uniref:hypothetical protein n=1 Tax=Streptomyces rimosus TaxID=1927 RepID=UPI0004C0B9B1|nr:hypothetical protein [Streptomyces rimosus]